MLCNASKATGDEMVTKVALANCRRLLAHYQLPQEGAQPGRTHGAVKVPLVLEGNVRNLEVIIAIDIACSGQIGLDYGGLGISYS